MIVRRLLNRISAEQTGSARNRKAFVSDLHGTERLLFRICMEQKGFCLWICTEQKASCVGSARNGKVFVSDLHGTERLLFRICTEQKGFCFGSAPNGKAFVSDLHRTESLSIRMGRNHMFKQCSLLTA